MEQFEKTVFTVSQLNNFIKGLFDEIPLFSNIYVSGEISNFTNHYRTGHFYFSLKDEKAIIKAVMFHSYSSRLKYMPENGMQVLVKARLSVFERDGVYQLYVEDMQPKGAGGLNLAFEQLKQKLGAEGLFEQSRKKALPRYPETIGVITSPTGAAIRDITNILKRRYPVADMLLEPVLVQGEGAPEQLVAALEKFNALKNCDVIIIGRGGGSIEDLWAFNDEAVARAIAASEIPVISAVGHETDFTISDFVADLRAPTPSAAAELAVPNIDEIKAGVAALKSALLRATRAKLQEQRLSLETLKNKPCLKNAGYIIDENRMKADALYQKLESLCALKLQEGRTAVQASAAKLDALSPLKVLARGYSVVRKEGAVISSADMLEVGNSIEIELSRGNIAAKVTEVTER